MPAQEGFATMSTKVDGLTGLRRAFAAAPAADMPRADCPPASRIWEAARGELAPARLRETLYHVAGCTVCTEAWRLAQALEEGSEVDLEESPEETPAPPGASATPRPVARSSSSPPSTDAEPPALVA